MFRQLQYTDVISIASISEFSEEVFLFCNNSFFNFDFTNDRKMLE